MQRIGFIEKTEGGDFFVTTPPFEETGTAPSLPAKMSSSTSTTAKKVQKHKCNTNRQLDHLLEAIVNFGEFL